ncbi:hypothetical protein ABZ840_16095 [Streptomyces sp. NPDC047117]|uniref:hypothetical protein n=1 Tax=Streptomyces sp. NPDC047117 TaxID=3155379 RepID=UPI003409D6BA
MEKDEGSVKFPYEGLCVKAVGELTGRSEIDVSVAEFGKISTPLDDAERVFRNMARRRELPFTSEIRDKFFRFNDIEVYWRSSESGSNLVGEFYLTHLYRSVLEKRMNVIWEGKDDWERELYSELRIFDDTPHSGSGRLAALRVAPGTTDPEIWFFDIRDEPLEMDLDYPTYLDTLLITKGTIGWQYLFCDVGYGHPGFMPIADGLKEMVEVFPRLFPEYDYSDLKARLRERT